MKRTLTILSAALLLTGFTSCSKYLDTLPLNDVVLENYWTEKNDVTSVLNSCYESLENRESIIRMAVWGELRSENIVSGTSVPNEFADALKETLLPASSLTAWSIFYQTINRCNTVIHYAPEVQQIDPNYTETELRATIAEATFIRDLCYFYLLRTFASVPIVFEASISDDEDFEVEPTPAFIMQNGQWVVGPALDILINDLKGVEDMAVRRYIDDSNMSNSTAASLATENSSRVTRNAIYALLAELNLWKGDFDETIRYCDLIIDAKKKQYEEKKENLGTITDMLLFNDIPLIRECEEGSTRCGNAITEIFGRGNSFESIFELYFQTNQRSSNDFINQYYGNASNSLGRFATPEENRKDVITGNNKLFSKDDCRAYGTMDNKTSKVSITKYVASSVSMSNRLSTLSDENSASITISRRSGGYTNWIIYRLTDIMLMKAEALVYKGEAYYEQAFELVDAVNRRARNIITAGGAGSLKLTDYNSSMTKMMEDLILQERKRDLMFEGKRWYDLVRYSIRTGNNSYLSKQATVKYQINVNSIQIRLSNPYTLFWPLNKNELKLNRKLKQNPAYGDTEDFQR